MVPQGRGTGTRRSTIQNRMVLQGRARNKKDLKQAEKWYRKAADRGSAEAKLELRDLEHDN